MVSARVGQPIDKQVGERVRMRRIMNGVTQVELAHALDITFQQVQKYERGANRISASRLHRIAQFLDVPVSFFFEDPSGSKGRPETALPDYLVGVMSTALGRKLVQAIALITDTKMRTNLLQ